MLSIQERRKTMESHSSNVHYTSTCEDMAPNNGQNTKNNSKEEDDEEDFHYEDEEIQRDAANEMVAFIVYIALGFFLFLFFGVTVFIFIIVGNYGFFVLLIISVLVLVVLAFGKFLLQTMDKDSVLKPARRKMKRWRAIATAVVVNEIKNFHLDMNDHLLLSYDGNYENDDDACTLAGEDRGKRKGKKKRRFEGTRSKIFALVVHPLLVKKNGKRRFGRENKKNRQNLDSEDYCHV